MRYLKKAGMELRKWRGNFFEANPEAGKTVLGLTWSTETDCLSLVVPKVDQKGNGSWSRRSLLKAVASLFDPLGYAAPVQLTGKILLQIAWQESNCWDEQLSHDL